VDSTTKGKCKVSIAVSTKSPASLLFFCFLHPLHPPSFHLQLSSNLYQHHKQQQQHCSSSAITRLFTIISSILVDTVSTAPQPDIYSYLASWFQFELLTISATPQPDIVSNNHLHPCHYREHCASARHCCLASSLQSDLSTTTSYQLRRLP